VLDCHFVVEQGITVLFGPSGSGKTTILRSIAGIVTPDEGRIELGDRVSILIRRQGRISPSSAAQSGLSFRITFYFRI
jgi:molybdate transport system ATP-binding protein